MKLKYTEKRCSGTFYELSVVSAVKENLRYDVDSFSLYLHNLKRDIESIPRRNVGNASNYYEVFETKTNTAEIWHLDSLGNKKRLLGTVSE